MPFWLPIRLWKIGIACPKTILINEWTSLLFPILRRTFYRPRDIVVFFNKIRAVHDSSTDSINYSKQDVYQAERDYSISLYNELIDEWAHQKPEIEGYLSALQDIGTQTFRFQEFESAFHRVTDKSSGAPIKEALSFLFQNSIVGQKVSINWEYVCSNPYMQIDFSKPFHVNNGLKARLTLTEARTSRH